MSSGEAILSKLQSEAAATEDLDIAVLIRIAGLSLLVTNKQCHYERNPRQHLVHPDLLQAIAMRISEIETGYLHISDMVTLLRFWPRLTNMENRDEWLGVIGRQARL